MNSSSESQISFPLKSLFIKRTRGFLFLNVCKYIFFLFINWWVLGVLEFFFSSLGLFCGFFGVLLCLGVAWLVDFWGGLGFWFFLFLTCNRIFMENPYKQWKTFRNVSDLISFKISPDAMAKPTWYNFRLTCCNYIYRQIQFAFFICFAISSTGVFWLAVVASFQFCPWTLYEGWSGIQF